MVNMTERKTGAGTGTLIIRDGQVLWGKRHDDPLKASSALHGEGTWTIPGGKLDFGEDFEESARREILEETGITAKKLQVICVSNERAPDAHFVTIGMLCTEFEGEPRVMEPDEITEWRWFPADEPPEPLFFPAEKILKNYMEKQFYKY